MRDDAHSIMKIVKRNRTCRPDGFCSHSQARTVKPGNRIARRIQIVVQALVGWIAIARPLRVGPQVEWNSPFFDPVLRGLKAGH